MDTPSPTLVLAAYGADLISGRRVVVFGSALSGLAETLVERGARLVHVYDEQPARVAEATARATTASVSYAPMGSGGIAARDGAFDVGIVENLLDASEPGKLVTRLRRALSARGVGFVCAPNPDTRSPLFTEVDDPTESSGSGEHSLGYYELYDLVSGEFDEIRMVGQTPFVGYALADFSPDVESEFSIDTAFVPGGAEEAVRYVAVCSHFPISLDPFCVVQLPANALLSRAQDSSAVPVPNVTSQLLATQDQLAEARATVKAELELRKKHEALLQQAREELQRRDEWVAELEARATTADERADNAQAELESAQQEAAALARELATEKQMLEAVQLELGALVDKRTALGSRESSLRSQLETLDVELTQRTDECNLLREELLVLSREQERMEGQLTERGRTILELQRALRDTEAFAAGLVVNQLGPPAADLDEEVTPEPADEFEALSSEHDQVPDQDDAEGPGLDSSPWLQFDAVDEDEEEAPASGPRSSLDGTELQAALQREAELAATLEAARWTVEELEAKVRAQNGEDFEEVLRQLHVAQQQLQRQAVLLEQYSAMCAQDGSRAAQSPTSDPRSIED